MLWCSALAALPLGAPRAVAPAKRALLVGLRMLTLAAPSRSCSSSRCWSRAGARPSRRILLIVLDDSESMKFSDPYTDNSRAVEIAASLKLESGGRQVAGGPAARDAAARAWSRRSCGPNLEALARGRELFLYDLESAAQPGGGANRRARASSTTSSRTGPSRPWAMRLHGVLAAHRGQPVAGVILATDGRSNTGEDPLRAVEAAARQNIPIFSIAAGADEGPRNIRLAEIEVSPVVFVRDPMTLAVVVEARGLRDAEATIVLEQRVNDGDVGSRSAASGSCWAKTASSSGPTFRITPRVVGQYEFRAGSKTPAPS